VPARRWNITGIRFATHLGIARLGMPARRPGRVAALLGMMLRSGRHDLTRNATSRMMTGVHPVASGLRADCELFACRICGISPAHAHALDPQQRVPMEGIPAA
jgi:hypothetical protein